MLRLAALLLMLASEAVAHGASATHLRQILTERAEDGTRVAVRLPASLLFAPAAAARLHPAQRIRAPLLLAERPGFFWIYRIDPDAPSEPLAALLAETVEVTTGGVPVPPEAIVPFHLADATPLSAAPAGIALSDAQIPEPLIEARYAAPREGAVEVAFPVDATLPPHTAHLETTLCDSVARLRDVSFGRLRASVTLPTK